MNSPLSSLLLFSILIAPLVSTPAGAEEQASDSTLRDVIGGPLIIEVEVVAGHALISPAGNGPTLSEQGAVIHVWVYDEYGDAVASFPYQDIWLDDIGDHSISLCQGGSTADALTDENGHTTISRSISGGGYAVGGTRVWVWGVPDDELLPLLLVSPDIDGNLIVDLADFGPFGTDYGSTQFRSDLNSDGVVDIVDFGLFGEHFQETCP